MTILLTIGHPDATPALLGLVGACMRAGVPYSCFFTGEGVHLLRDADVCGAATHAVRAVVCEHSWARYVTDQASPVELGSQTDHSGMMGEVDRVVSL